jgi:hypothetical protein
VIVSFRYPVGTILVHGIVKERDRATADFCNEQASLLWEHTLDVFTTSLSTITSAQTAVVEIRCIVNDT